MEKTSPQILLPPCQDTLCLGCCWHVCYVCQTQSPVRYIVCHSQFISLNVIRIFFFFFFPRQAHVAPPGKYWIQLRSCTPELSVPGRSRVLFRLRSAGGELEQIFFSLSLSLSIQDVTSARTLTATVKTVFLIDSERRFLVADIASRGVGELPSHTPHVAARYHHPPNADLLHKLWATSTESDTVCSQI